MMTPLAQQKGQHDGICYLYSRNHIYSHLSIDGSCSNLINTPNTCQIDFLFSVSCFLQLGRPLYNDGRPSIDLESRVFLSNMALDGWSEWTHASSFFSSYLFWPVVSSFLFSVDSPAAIKVRPANSRRPCQPIRPAALHLVGLLTNRLLAYWASMSSRTRPTM